MVGSPNASNFIFKHSLCCSDQPQLCAAFQQFSKFFLESASPSIRNTAFALLYDCLKGNFHKRSAFEMFAVSLPVLDSSCAFFQDESNVEVMLHLLSIAASEAAMPLCMGVYINKVCLGISLASRNYYYLTYISHCRCPTAWPTAPCRSSSRSSMHRTSLRTKICMRCFCLA